LYRRAEVVDMDAYKLAFQHVMNQPLSDDAEELHRKLIAGYQYLRAHKKSDGFLDESAMATFLSLHKESKNESL
ncbi:XRE family transcriptional regulator, partial [Vibrio parahaemolyticus]|nr:XRE family transcriptional regulator [Vibrio parahaemolyticus]